MGKKFAVFDQDGVLVGRYDSDVHGANVPSAAIEISADDFKRSIVESDGTWVLAEKGRLEKKPPQPPALDEAKAQKIAEIDSAFEKEAAGLIAGYPSSERLTWPVQQAEALAWKADQNTPTPYLDTLAEARGIEPADMRQRTLDQTEMFMSVSGPMLGKRQRLRDEVHEAKTMDEVNAISW